MKLKLIKDKRQPMGVVVHMEDDKIVRSETVPHYLEIDWVMMNLT